MEVLQPPARGEKKSPRSVINRLLAILQRVECHRTIFPKKPPLLAVADDLADQLPAVFALCVNAIRHACCLLCVKSTFPLCHARRLFARGICACLFPVRPALFRQFCQKLPPASRCKNLACPMETCRILCYTCKRHHTHSEPGIFCLGRRVPQASCARPSIVYNNRDTTDGGAPNSPH